MRAIRVTMWARAASVVPAATVSGGEAADAVSLEDGGDRSLADAPGLVGGRRGLPELDQPGGAEIGVEIEEGREVAPQLLAQAIGERGALAAEVLCDARPFPEFDDGGIGGGELAEAMRIGAQGRGHHQGVAAVVLGAGHRVAVAEAVHLLGIEGMDGEAALDQRLDHRPMRHLDGDVDLAGLGGAAGRQQPGHHLGQALAGMLEDFLADVAALLIDEPHMVALAGPVDTAIPSFLIAHAVTPLQTASHRDPCRYLYWCSPRSRRERHRLPTGRRSRPIRRGTCPPQVIESRGAIGCSRRTGSVLETTTFWAVACGRAGVPLRSTPPLPRRFPRTAWKRYRCPRSACPERSRRGRRAKVPAGRTADGATVAGTEDSPVFDNRQELGCHCAGEGTSSGGRMFDRRQVLVGAAG